MVSFYKHGTFKRETEGANAKYEPAFLCLPASEDAVRLVGGVLSGLRSATPGPQGHR